MLVLPVYALDKEVKIDYSGGDFEFYKNDVLSIETGMQKYLLDAEKMTDDYAELKIADKLVKLSSYYPVRKIDADDDGYFDLVVALKGLESNKVILNIKQISEKDMGWIAFEDAPVIEAVKGIQQTEIKQVEEPIEVTETNNTIDNKELFEKLMKNESEKPIVKQKNQTNLFVNLTIFSRTYFDKVKEAVIQIPYIGFIIAGLVILTILILLMEFVFGKKEKKVKKKVKKKKGVFEKFIDFLLEEEG